MLLANHSASVLYGRLSQVYWRLERVAAEQERSYGALLDERNGDDAVSAVKTGTEEASLLAARLQASLAHGLYTSWHFLAMLAIMTYNVGVCVVLCMGITIGHFVFKTGRSARERNGATVMHTSCHEVTKPAESTAEAAIPAMGSLSGRPHSPPDLIPTSQAVVGL